MASSFTGKNAKINQFEMIFLKITQACAACRKPLAGSGLLPCGKFLKGISWSIFVLKDQNILQTPES